jgi:hypothetical protein
VTGTGSLVGTFRAAGLLARLSAPGRAAPTPRPRRTAGLACDWYEPRGRPRALVVALHGVTVNGKDHPRLREFAAALAASGTSCLVPTLPGLAALRWDAADVEAIGGVLEAATAAEARPAVVVGFSHGASLGLLAAARAASAPRVSYLRGFGAYHSLARVFERIRGLALPEDARDRSDFVYAHLVEARRRADALGMPADLRAAADDLLRRFCDQASDAEKLRFFDRHLRPLAMSGRPDAAADATFAALSPEGRLAGLTCPVGLVADPDDLLVTPSDARALLAELRRAAPEAEHRLLVTRLVRHVSLAGGARLAEGLRLLRMLGPLLAPGR